MIFVVGDIGTTHYQATSSEYVYVYVRMMRSLNDKSYLITHAGNQGFSLFFEPRQEPPITSGTTAVPIRITVAHNMNMTPPQMTQAGFDYVAETVIHGACHELSGRVPKRKSCTCGYRPDMKLMCRRPEFVIQGLIRHS